MEMAYIYLFGWIFIIKDLQNEETIIFCLKEGNYS